MPASNSSADGTNAGRSRSEADPGDTLRTPLHLIHGVLDVVLAGEAGPISGEVLRLLATMRPALMTLEAAIEGMLAMPEPDRRRRRFRRPPPEGKRVVGC